MLPARADSDLSLSSRPADRPMRRDSRHLCGPSRYRGVDEGFVHRVGVLPVGIRCVVNCRDCVGVGRPRMPVRGRGFRPPGHLRSRRGSSPAACSGVVLHESAEFDPWGLATPLWPWLRRAGCARATGCGRRRSRVLPSDARRVLVWGSCALRILPRSLSPRWIVRHGGLVRCCCATLGCRRGSAGTCPAARRARSHNRNCRRCRASTSCQNQSDCEPHRVSRRLLVVGPVLVG